MLKKKKSKITYSIIGCFSLVSLALITYGVYWFVHKSNNNKSNKDADYGQNSVSESDYVRSPYGLKFEIKDSNDLEFIVAYSHFDSPGVNNSVNSLNQVEKISNLANQGEQEVNEAKNIGNVLDYFRNYFSSENIIFMGDTNIKLGNENQAFQNLTSSYYSMLFKDNHTYNTSLGNQENVFSNPYDKIIYHLNSNQFSIAQDSHSYEDIKKVIQPDYEFGFAINTYLTLPANNFVNGSGWITYSDLIYENKTDKSTYQYVKYAISDHLPVGTDLSYVNLARQNSAIRFGGWNVLNLNLNTGNLQNFNVNNLSQDNSEARRKAHATNVAKIIYKVNYDVVGLLEILKSNTVGNTMDFVNYLNYLAQSENRNDVYYRAVLSDSTPAIKTDSGQIEKVLVIYNSKKLSLSSINPRFYTSAIAANLKNFIYEIQRIMMFKNLDCVLQ